MAKRTIIATKSYYQDQSQDSLRKGLVSSFMGASFAYIAHAQDKLDLIPRVQEGIGMAGPHVLLGCGAALLAHSLSEHLKSRKAPDQLPPQFRTKGGMSI